jgi:hypothetical protein
MELAKCRSRIDRCRRVPEAVTEVPRPPPDTDCRSSIHQDDITGGALLPLQHIAEDPGVLFRRTSGKVFW